MGIANVFCTDSEATGARAESPAGKTLVKLCLANVFATSNRRSICFRSDEEIEAVPTESVRLERKSTEVWMPN
ncbi:hypothetical protein MKY29_01115 [Psychrobacillus sp. FSL K6-2365]|uniref:hypothetical protein n=1 Tax=Psychrobacillus sp. FSL K6-2365 TaxID=2921546 RepID=UPI0030FAAF02